MHWAAGIVCAMASDDSQSLIARQPDLAMRDELTTQLSLTPSRFVVINTAGVVELEKRRPVDTLALILEERNTAKLEQFFRSYGAAEVAAMCFMLATQSPSAVPQASRLNTATLLTLTIWASTRRTGFTDRIALLLWMMSNRPFWCAKSLLLTKPMEVTCAVHAVIEAVTCAFLAVRYGSMHLFVERKSCLELLPLCMDLGQQGP